MKNVILLFNTVAGTFVTPWTAVRRRFLVCSRHKSGLVQGIISVSENYTSNEFLSYATLDEMYK
jgi:hypothetical protein